MSDRFSMYLFKETVLEKLTSSEIEKQVKEPENDSRFSEYTKTED